MKEEPPESQPPPRKRFRWLRREGIDLGDAVVQFIAVLLGVLFALLISQWNDHRQQQAKAQAAMRQQQAEVHEAVQAIHLELVANRATLHDTATGIYKMAKFIQASPKNQNQPPRPCYLWYGWSGTGFALTDAAYQTAIATRALAHMPFKQAQLVAQAYANQHSSRNAFALMRNKFFLAGPHTVGMCVYYLENFVFNEQGTSAAYTPLIGPDKTKWPNFPVNPTPPTQP